MWTTRLVGQPPQWTTLYKPPLNKRTGDLQWSILHGAIATNPLVLILNVNAVSQCPLCSKTVLHISEPDWQRLTAVLNKFGDQVMAPVFIGGFKYKKRKKVPTWSSTWWEETGCKLKQHATTLLCRSRKSEPESGWSSASARTQRT